ncbi:kinase-like domain-containing protein [Favolaschia claudopus]|uniref:Kinase-like domain-containing protein n=1 Tax=Favolaschia claudopus TaxID=2862362 RepID=A0AAV9ZP87_9AGAR
MSTLDLTSTIFAVWLAANPPGEGIGPLQDLREVTTPDESLLRASALLASQPDIASQLGRRKDMNREEIQQLQHTLQGSAIMPALILGGHLAFIRPDKSILLRTWDFGLGSQTLGSSGQSLLIPSPEVSIDSHDRVSIAASSDSGHSVFGEHAATLVLASCLGRYWDHDDRVFDATDYDFTNLKNYVLGKKLGAGKFGSVSVVHYHPNKSLVAVKSMNRNHTLGVKEAGLLKQANHKHIVKFLGFTQDHEQCLVFMEYASGGTLEQLAKALGPLQEVEVTALTCQIADGLVHLHDLNIIHRDLKGANIVISLDGCVKITDLGCAKKIDGNLQMSHAGTFFWMSPEMVLQTPYNATTDVWSLGIVIVELMSGGHPWLKERDGQGRPLLAALQDITKGEVPIPPNASRGLQQLLHDQMFIVDKSKRLTSAQLQRHPWLT